MPSRLEAALARHRAFSIAALAILTVLAWVWLVTGSGVGIGPLVSLAPMPSGDMPMGDMPMMRPHPWSLSQFAMIFAMWWVMMVAMMLPSAAPMILLYARAAEHAQADEAPASGMFISGYLLSWAIFSLAASLLQTFLVHSDLLTTMPMSSQSHLLSAGIFIAAGIYQLSPLKDVCLSRCRNPAQFLSAFYRPGKLGALRMGLLHGIYCVGCCWLLMMLLFVGGVMNLAWIAILTLLVAAEKLLSFGPGVSKATGVACILWGLSFVFA